MKIAVTHVAEQWREQAVLGEVGLGLGNALRQGVGFSLSAVRLWALTARMVSASSISARASGTPI